MKSKKIALYVQIALIMTMSCCEKKEITETKQKEYICWDCVMVLYNQYRYEETFCRAEELNIGRTGIITEEIIRLYEQYQNSNPQISYTKCKKSE